MQVVKRYQLNANHQTAKTLCVTCTSLRESNFQPRCCCIWSQKSQRIGRDTEPLAEARNDSCCRLQNPIQSIESSPVTEIICGRRKKPCFEYCYLKTIHHHGQTRKRFERPPFKGDSARFNQCNRMAQSKNRSLAEDRGLVDLIEFGKLPLNGKGSEIRDSSIKASFYLLLLLFFPSYYFRLTAASNRFVGLFGISVTFVLYHGCFSTFNHFQRQN